MQRTQSRLWTLPSVSTAICRTTLVTGILLIGALCGRADLPIYTDSLLDGWTDAAPGTGIHDFSNTSPVYSGTHSIAVTIPANQNSASIFCINPPAVDATSCNYLSFQLNGGTEGVFWTTVIIGYWGGLNHDWYWYGSYGLGGAAPNTWRNIDVALPSPNVQDPSVFTAFQIYVGYDNLSSFPYDTTFCIDDIRLTVVPEPAASALAGLGLLAALAWRLRR